MQGGSYKFAAGILPPAKRPSNTLLPHLFALASLFAGWWVAKGGGLPWSSMGRLGTALLLTCPVFFSGIIFSTLLSKESSISGVMGINLFGAVCGGILEYNSMYTGFRFLYLLAMGLYAMSFFSTLLPGALGVARAPGDRGARTVNEGSR